MVLLNIHASLAIKLLSAVFKEKFLMALFDNFYNWRWLNNKI